MDILFQGFFQGVLLKPIVVHNPRNKLGYGNWDDATGFRFGDDVLPKACFLKEDHVLEVQGASRKEGRFLDIKPLS